MSIIMHTGRPGTGKTYNLTKRILKHLKDGKSVFCNYNIDKNYVEEMFKINCNNLFFWENVKELRGLEKGIIAIDEAHVYFNSRRWKGLDETMERKLAQHRKDGLHIEGTVQAVTRLDIIFRELIDYWYVYEDKRFWFVRWEFDLDQDKSKKYVLSKRWIAKRKKIYNCYDTLEKIKHT